MEIDLLIILLCLVPVSAIQCDRTIQNNVTCSSDSHDYEHGCFSAECTYGISKPYKTFALKGCGGAKTCLQMNFVCNQMHGSRVINASCQECDTDNCNH